MGDLVVMKNHFFVVWEIFYWNFSYCIHSLSPLTVREEIQQSASQMHELYNFVHCLQINLNSLQAQVSTLQCTYFLAWPRVCVASVFLGVYWILDGLMGRGIEYYATVLILRLSSSWLGVYFPVSSMLSHSGIYEADQILHTIFWITLSNRFCYFLRVLCRYWNSLQESKTTFP